MGHVNNQLATLVCGVFAAVLTGLWPLMVNFAPILNIVFLMAVPIMWFLTFIVWIAQEQQITITFIITRKKSSDELSTYKDNLKDISSDAEIKRLKKEIEHLKTRVEIESIRAEIYNLKMLAVKRN